MTKEGMPEEKPQEELNEEILEKRPTYSNLNVSYGELQIIKTGFAWKILY